jgi:hypothetical protein
MFLGANESFKEGNTDINSLKILNMTYTSRKYFSDYVYILYHITLKMGFKWLDFIYTLKI